MAASSNHLGVAYLGGRLCGFSIVPTGSVQDCKADKHYQGECPHVHVPQQWRKQNQPSFRLVAILDDRRRRLAILFVVWFHVYV
jgi:hypothetical protein